MNKYDWLVTIIFIISIPIIFLIQQLPRQVTGDKKAEVFYENSKILTIDLSIPEKKIYEVDGYNGKVKIEAIDGKIRVIEEKSPLHLCSKQGYISETYESIICLPNKIVINIKANDDYDTVIE